MSKTQLDPLTHDEENSNDDSEPIDTNNNKNCGQYFSITPIRSAFITIILIGCIIAILYDVNIPHKDIFVPLESNQTHNLHSGCGLSVNIGDCNPNDCPFGICEARYIRYFDDISKVDRTKKFCQCVETPMCNLIGMKIHSGCRDYAGLSEIGQEMIIKWSMTAMEKNYNNNINKKRQIRNIIKINASISNNKNKNIRKIRNDKKEQILFSEEKRHLQLFEGITKFCCRRSKVKARFMASSMFKSNGSLNELYFNYYLTFILFICFYYQYF
uniref:EB domain-containing protein n=1 Tax=Parastrongyloides trichosuri TaxID=131310 RepID=A0A0N4ZX22_PARTI